MFNVIRIPTKFSKTIKRMSNEERLQVFDLLIKIGDGGEISPPDNIVGDVVQLIYGEWMNMEAKNGVKREKSSINLCSEGPGEVVPSDPGTRVEYSRVEESRREYNKEGVLEEENKQIQDTKTKKKKVYDYSDLLSQENSFAKEALTTLTSMGWTPSTKEEEFISCIDEILEMNQISKDDVNFKKWKYALNDFKIYWSSRDERGKKPLYLSKLRNSPSFRFNLPKNV